MTALTNGNYVVKSRFWDNGTVVNAGAVTWGSGTAGVTGVVSSSNSLVGSSANDSVGSNVRPFTNGNYVVTSQYWDNGTATDAGAVTWGNGTAGVAGVVSAANSLVGSSANDQVGSDGGTDNAVALSNGNYLVNSRNWDNGTVVNAGAVTWGNGLGGTVGVVSSANSLVGSSANDSVTGGTALSNGNYLVTSQTWDNGTVVNAGAVTWGNGTAGVSGVISSSNSLVGSKANDVVGGTNNLITTLTNGNYLVRSQTWDNGTVTDAGAVTWGSGTAGVSGVISAANSLVGSTANDSVGRSDSLTLTGLTNGNYVVFSSFWDNGTGVNAGAVTWGSGTAGVTGGVSSTNSLVGSTTGDSVGSTILTVLTNGNYLVRSNNWDNGTISNAGAVTWGSGTAGVSGAISSSNSLLGTVANGSPGTPVSDTVNGTFVVGFSGASLGKVYVASSTGSTLAGYDGFSDVSTMSVTLDPGFLTATLNNGTALTLQASNDITVSNAITASNGSGNGGVLTLQAGRSILLNANITTDDGNLFLYANEKASAGVVDAYRDAGAAAITMGSGTVIDAGSGAVSIRLDNGSGNTHSTAGDITLRSVTASSILVQTTASTSDIILGSGAALSASGGGNAITLASGRNFINSATTPFALSGGGRWLVYSTNPASNTLNSLTGDFNRYSCSYSTAGACTGGTITMSGSGNGLLYSYTPILTITPSAQSTTYGDAATLSGYGYSVAGYLAGEGTDTVTGSLTGTSDYTTGSNIGTYYLNYASGTLASALGYGISSYANNATAITVGQRTLTAGLTGTVSKGYDGTNTATLASGNYTLSTIYSSDDVSIATTAGTYDTATVGTGKTVSVTGLTLTGAKAGNYMLASSSTSGAVGSVTQRVITITAGNQSQTYGVNHTLSGGYSVTSGSLVSGEAITGGVSLSTNATDSTSGNWIYNATPWTITATGTPTGTGGFTSGNYAVTFATGSLTIARKTLTVSATGVNKGYDGTTTGTVTLGDDRITNDVFTSRTYTAATFADPNVASGIAVHVTGIAISGGDAGNYSLAASTADTTANITQRAITITADNKFALYGAAIPPGTVTYAGFITGENASILAVAPIIRSAASGIANPGIYPGNYTASGATVSGASAANYVIGYVPGNLIISPLPNTFIKSSQETPTDFSRYAGWWRNGTADGFTWLEPTPATNLPRNAGTITPGALWYLPHNPDQPSLTITPALAHQIGFVMV